MRPDLTRLVRFIVTIDGPAGTGKSSVGRTLAKRLGLSFLDTGAMYRAATAIVLDRGIDPADHDAVTKAVEAEDLHFDWTKDPPSMLCSGISVDGRIREQDVTGTVSVIAAIAPLRQHMVRKQRIVAHQHPHLVTEGRDQGSIAFPDAEIKIYLDASSDVRARRRAAQLRAAGHKVDEDNLQMQIIERDRLDSSRHDGPLICPDDAIRVDTSHLDFDQVVDVLEQIVLAETTPTKKKQHSCGSSRA